LLRGKNSGSGDDDNGADGDDNDLKHRRIARFLCRAASTATLRSVSRISTHFSHSTPNSEKFAHMPHSAVAQFSQFSIAGALG
jgi:hypothetical protein